MGCLSKGKGREPYCWTEGPTESCSTVFACIEWKTLISVNPPEPDINKFKDLKRLLDPKLISGTRFYDCHLELLKLHLPILA